MKKKTNILLVGNIIGSYRSQLLLDYLSGRNYDYNFIYVDSRFYSFDWVPLPTKARKAIAKIYINVVYFVSLLNTDIVYYLPMNEGFRWIFHISSLLNVEIVSEFYSSRFLLKKENAPINQSNKLGNKSLAIDKLILEYSNKVVFLGSHEARFYIDTLRANMKDIQEKVVVHPLKQAVLPQAKLNWFNGSAEFIHICWWGKASKLHGLERMLQLLSDYRVARKDFKVELFENNRQRSEYISGLIDELKMTDYVEVRHDLTFNNGLSEYLIDNCDLALGSFGATNMSKNVLMNKLVDCLNMAIPVVTEYSSSFDDFELNDLFYVVSGEEFGDFEIKMDKALSKSFDEQLYQRQSKERFERFFNAKSSVEFYEKIL